MRVLLASLFVVNLLLVVAPAWAGKYANPQPTFSVDENGDPYTPAAAGDGAVLDGDSAAIRGTVRDYTNGNPLTVEIVDTNGDPASIGGGTQYQQGSAATDTDTKTMVGCVRADTAAVATGVADGDRARCIVDATGRLWVHVGTIDGGTISTITNPVTVTDGAGSLNVIVDSGTITTITNAVTVTDGAGALNVIVDSGTVSTITNPVTVTDGAGSLNVIVDSGTVTTITNPVTVTDGAGSLNVIVDSGVVTGAAADGAAVSGNPHRIAGKDGSGNTQDIITDAAGELQVDVLTMPTVTVTDGAGAMNVIVDSGSITVSDGSGALNVIVDSGTVTVAGAAADGAAVSGNPVRLAGKDGSGNTQDIITDTSGELQVDVLTLPNVTIGTFPDNEPFNMAQIAGTAPNAHDGVISSDTVPLTISCYSETAEDSDGNTNPNRVSADADKTRVLCDRNGTLYTRLGPPHRWAYHENSSSALTDTTVHASCGTGLYNYVESITFSTGGATAASVLIEDSTTSTILGPYYLEAVAGRGMHITYPGGRKQTNSATLISVTTTGAVAHGLDVIGFCAP